MIGINPVTQSATATSSPRTIELRDVVRRFGRVEALRGLSFSVAPGRIAGLIGNNGAGKTTAIHTLLGFIPPHEGSVSILGLDPRRDALTIRGRAGFFPERDQPYEWMRIRVLFDIGAAAFPDWDKELCATLTKRFDIDARRRIKDLSKGMVAKAKLVFALSHRPECLLLDEPTSGLDPGSRHDLLTMIRELTTEQGITTLFSSHNLDDVQGIAGDLVIIHEGRTLLSDSMDSIRRELLLVEFKAASLPELPSASMTVLRTSNRDGSIFALIRSQEGHAVDELAGAWQADQWTQHPLTLPALFLFLTSGWVEMRNHQTP